MDEAFIADWQTELGGWVVEQLFWQDNPHLCSRHLRCPARQASASAGSSSHLSHLRGSPLRRAGPDSCLARLAGWMNELKWRVSEWVPGGSCGWAELPLGKGGQASGQCRQSPGSFGASEAEIHSWGKSKPAAHPSTAQGGNNQAGFLQQPTDHQTADWSSHSSTSLQNPSLGKKDIKPPHGVRN